MNILVLFWLNSDNFQDVIRRDYNYTIEEQCHQYEKEHFLNPDSIMAIEKTID
jgi:hypothetical protein